MKLPTIEIVNPRNPAYMVRINEQDFDPKLHTLWSAKDALQTQKETETPEEIDVKSMESRYLELSSMKWKQIEQLHEIDYELGDYPGKEEAILSILKHEGLE